jgi:hypothetical protein
MNPTVNSFSVRDIGFKTFWLRLVRVVNDFLFEIRNDLKNRKSSVNPVARMSFGRTLFCTSTVLDIKKDSSGMTTWFIEHLPKI